MEKFQKRQLLLIEWEDIGVSPTWEHEHIIKPAHEVVLCRSVGWKIASDRRYITIAASRSSLGNCSDRISIPRGCIKKIEKILGVKDG